MTYHQKPCQILMVKIREKFPHACQWERHSDHSEVKSEPSVLYDKSILLRTSTFSKCHLTQREGRWMTGVLFGSLVSNKLRKIGEETLLKVTAQDSVRLRELRFNSIIIEYFSSLVLYHPINGSKIITGLQLSYKTQMLFRRNFQGNLKNTKRDRNQDNRGN